MHSILNKLSNEAKKSIIINKHAAALLIGNRIITISCNRQTAKGTIHAERSVVSLYCGSKGYYEKPPWIL